MTKDQALKHALEKFEYMNHIDSIFHGEFDFQINAIKKALAQQAEPIGASEETQRFAIQVEKLLCEKLGRKWSPSGISIQTLVDELADRKAQQAEPDYYGLTKDHLWMSITKDHYDRLKPEFRMACYTSPPPRQPEQDVVAMADYMALMEKYVALKAAQPKQKPVAIEWTLDGDKSCGYNNWVGNTPFGRILITWKGWKEHHDACVDEFPGEFNAYGTPDEVKAECEAEFARRLNITPPPRQPLKMWTEAQHERAYRNNPELHNDVKSLAAFKRVAKEIAAMYGIKGEA